MAILASENIRTAAAVTAMDRIGYATLVGGVNGGGAMATTWWGDASDGNLLVSAGTTHSEPVTLDSGYIVKNYNNLTIEKGAIWQPANRCNGTVICVYGDLTIDGTLRVDAKAPLVNDKEEEFLALRWVKLPGITGGGNGGNGGSAKITGSGTPKLSKLGSRGTGGSAFPLGGGFGGGGAPIAAAYLNNNSSTAATTNAASGTRPPIGTKIPYPVSTGNAYGNGGVASLKNSAGTVITTANGGGGPGGSGPIAFRYNAGSADDEKKVAGSNGSAIGGGFVAIYVRGRVVIGSSGKITANGGNGAAAKVHTHNTIVGVISGGGGGGGGGIIIIVHNGNYINNGTIAANGGNGGASQTSLDVTAGAGANGSIGKVLVANISELLTA